VVDFGAFVALVSSPSYRYVYPTHSFVCELNDLIYHVP